MPETNEVQGGNRFGTMKSVGLDNGIGTGPGLRTEVEVPLGLVVTRFPVIWLLVTNRGLRAILLLVHKIF